MALEPGSISPTTGCLPLELSFFHTNIFTFCSTQVSVWTYSAANSLADRSSINFLHSANEIEVKVEIVNNRGCEINCV